MLKRFMGYRCFRRPLPLIARPWSHVARPLSLEIPLCLPYCTYLTLLCLTLLTCFTYLPVGKQLLDGSRVVNLKLVARRLSLEIPLSLPYFTYLTLHYLTLLTYLTCLPVGKQLFDGSRVANLKLLHSHSVVPCSSLAGRRSLLAACRSKSCYAYLTSLTLLYLTLLTYFTYLPAGKQFFDGSRVANLTLLHWHSGVPCSSLASRRSLLAARRSRSQYAYLTLLTLLDLTLLYLLMLLTGGEQSFRRK